MNIKDYEVIEDDFLIQKKTSILNAVFLTMSITGILVSTFEYFSYGLSTNFIIQISGTLFILIATVDLFTRKNIHQSAVIFTTFSLIFLNIRYYTYSSYMAPSVIWLTALAPSITWVSGRKFGVLSFVAATLSIIANATILYMQSGTAFTRPDVIFLGSSIITAGFLTYVIAQTQELYYHHLEEKINIEITEIHRGQLASLGELAGNVAHEMNNPLHVIKGNSSRLYRKLEDLNVDQTEENLNLKKKLQTYAQSIDRTVDKTKTIVDSLLKLSRKGEDDVTLVSTSLTEVWNQAYPLLDSKIRQSNASISFFNMEKKFHGHPEYLAQILINLVSNSLYEINTQDKPWVRVEFRNNRIDVVDSGEGIKEDEKNKVLTPFYTTKGNKGTGLGLPLCAALMKQMGGELTIPKEQDHTTIRLLLPEQIQN